MNSLMVNELDGLEIWFDPFEDMEVSLYYPSIEE